MGILRYFAFLLLLLVILMPAAFGSGFTFDGTGVKARGMGGAFRAVADDWSAAYYNPAGLARIKDNSLNGNLDIFHNRYWIKPNINWGGEYESGFYNGQDVANDHQILNVPQAGLVVRLPLWGETVWGLSIYQLFDQNQTWHLYHNIPGYNGANYPREQFYNNLDVVAFQLSIARTFMQDKLAVGLGLAVLRGDLTYADVALRQNPMPEPISVRPYDKIPEWYRVDVNGYGFGYRIGVLYKATEKLNAALVYSGKSSVDLDGHTAFKFYMGDNPTLIRNNNYFQTSEEYLFASGRAVDISSLAKTKLELPATFGGGVSYQLTKKLTVDLDAEMVFWSKFTGFNFDFSQFSGLPDSSFHYANDLYTGNINVPMEWDDASRVMLGGQYQALSYLQVRAGFAYDQSPIKDNSVVPQFIDLGTRYSYSLGLGFTVGFWSFDIAGVYIHQPDLTVTSMSDLDGDGLMDNLMGDYRASNYETTLGISYRF